MRTFSWKECKERAIQNACKYEETLAKTKNPDFVIRHPDEARDAEQKNFAKLQKRVTNDIKKFQEVEQERRKISVS